MHLLNVVEAAPSEAELAWQSVEFRLRVLSACGFDAADALALAIRPELGMDEPLRLVRNGCSPALATRILT